MKAILLTQHGDADVLTMSDAPTPIPSTGEVLIRLKAASVNRVDTWVRKGHAAYPVTLPHIFGADGAGVVESLGMGAEGVSPGDRVVILPGLSCGDCAWCRVGRDNQCDTYSILGTRRPGTYAEFVAVPDSNVWPLPDGISFEEAAAFPLAYLTAWHLVIGRAHLMKGETVVVVGAGAGVGIASIQIARAHGARVLAVTSSPAKSEAIRNAGAHDVHVSAGEDFSGWVKEKTNGSGANIVVEHVGPATWASSFASLAKCGRLVTCGATSGPTVSLELRGLFSRDATILGGRMGTKKEFRDLAAEVFEGRLQPIIDCTFPLDQAADAHRHMESGAQAGKIVLKIS